MVTLNNSNKSQSLLIEKSSHVSSIPIWLETLLSILMLQKELKNISIKSSVLEATLIPWVSPQSEELLLIISAEKITYKHHQSMISSLLKVLLKEFISFWKLWSPHQTIQSWSQSHSIHFTLHPSVLMVDICAHIIWANKKDGNSILKNWKEVFNQPERKVKQLKLLSLSTLVIQLELFSMPKLYKKSLNFQLKINSFLSQIKYFLIFIKGLQIKYLQGRSCLCLSQQSS